MLVTLFKGGTKEVTLQIGHVQIPDVWKILEALEDDIDSMPGREKLLECWHIAGALKHHLQSPLYDAAQPMLDALKATKSWMEDCLLDKGVEGMPSRVQYNAICAAIALAEKGVE